MFLKSIRGARLGPALALAGALSAYAMPAAAAPMAYSEGIMFMHETSSNWRENTANYAVTANNAVGFGNVYMRSDDRTRARSLNELTYTRKLFRANLPNAQANVWLLGGVGEVSRNERPETTFSYSPGIQLDYETTRVFVLGSYRAYRSDDLNHDMATARAGFSFYEVDYDEAQPWFILEARRMNGLSDQIELTPMLRLIHNRYFIDLGITNGSALRINFMFTY